MSKSNSAAVAVRALHLDLKGVPPTPKRLCELPRIAGAFGYNAILVEWEDMFPWTVDSRIRCETAYTPAEVKRFCRAASDQGMELIPLVQCLGHMEFVLKLPGYEHMREVANEVSVLNPLAPGAGELIARLYDDVLALMPGVRRFHLGGDEAWSLGTHKDTSAYIARHGKGALYLRHVEPLIARLSARGIRSMLWHDMMRDWDGSSLAKLGQQADLVLWGYAGHPESMGEHVNTAIIGRFRKNGIKLWGATAYKGADGLSADLPDYGRREENAVNWMEAVRKYGFEGMITTAWSRYSHCLVQCEPIDSCLDSMANHGFIFLHGKRPAAGRDHCLRVIERLGERPAFEACRDAMVGMATLRNTVWPKIRQWREEIRSHELDARRNFSLYKWTRREMSQFNAECDCVTAAVRTAFKRFMPRIWIDRYLGERLDPIRDEFIEVVKLISMLERVKNPYMSSSSKGNGSNDLSKVGKSKLRKTRK